MVNFDMKKLVFTITTFENLALVLANLESLKNRTDTDLFIVLNDTVDTCGKYNALKTSGIDFISLDGVLFNEGSCQKKEERLKVSKNKTLAIPIVIRYFVRKGYNDICYLSDNVCVRKPEWVLDKKESGITLYLNDIKIDENLYAIKNTLSLDIWKVKITEQTENFLNLVNKNICSIDNNEKLCEILVFYSLSHKEINIIKDDQYVFVPETVDLRKLQEGAAVFNYVEVHKIAKWSEILADNKVNAFFEKYAKKVSDYKKFILLKSKDSRKLGINIFGYFEDTMSMALTARNFADKVLLSGIPTNLINYSYFENKNFEKYRSYYSNKRNDYVNILISDCSEIINRNNKYLNNDRPVYALTFWEFETGLEKYIEVTRYVDGFISTSEFCHWVFERTFSNSKLFYIPFPFKLDDQREKIKNKSDVEYAINSIPKDKFKLYFNFDLNSSFFRKNPLGILEAVKYSRHKGEIYLIIKINGTNNKEESIKDILKKVDDLGLSDSVLIVDGFISDDDMRRLLRGSDAYISLHRGEGVGLGMIEAMANGVPVIATGYSGNTQFCTPETSALVSYNLVKCTDPLEAYSEVENWAEPDYKVAGNQIDALIENSQEKKISEAKLKLEQLYNDKYFITSLFNFLFSTLDNKTIYEDNRVISIKKDKSVKRTGRGEIKHQIKTLKYKILATILPVERLRSKYIKKLRDM